MVNLILCLTLFNIGVVSKDARIFNAQLNKIERIMNNDGSGDIMQDYVSMPCRVAANITIDIDGCINPDLNTIMNHYKLRRELNLINIKENN